MEDLSLHVLDIVENSMRAKADRIEIIISEDKKMDLLSIEISDNGIGMEEETVKKVLDPFFTLKTNCQFGLGLPLLSEAAKAADGDLSIKSKKGGGTKIKATFKYSHIDRKPLGDIGQTIITFMMGNPEIDLIYIHRKNSRKYYFESRKIKAQLKNKPINSPEGIRKLKEDLKRYKRN